MLCKAIRSLLGCAIALLIVVLETAFSAEDNVTIVTNVTLSTGVYSYVSCANNAGELLTITSVGGPTTWTVWSESIWRGSLNTKQVGSTRSSSISYSSCAGSVLDDLRRQWLMCSVDTSGDVTLAALSDPGTWNSISFPEKAKECLVIATASFGYLLKLTRFDDTVGCYRSSRSNPMSMTLLVDYTFNSSNTFLETFTENGKDRYQLNFLPVTPANAIQFDSSVDENVRSSRMSRFRFAQVNQADSSIDVYNGDCAPLKISLPLTSPDISSVVSMTKVTDVYYAIVVTMFSTTSTTLNVRLYLTKIPLQLCDSGIQVDATYGLSAIASEFLGTVSSLALTANCLVWDLTSRRQDNDQIEVRRVTITLLPEYLSSLVSVGEYPDDNLTDTPTGSPTQAPDTVNSDSFTVTAVGCTVALGSIIFLAALSSTLSACMYGDEMQSYAELR